MANPALPNLPEHLDCLLNQPFSSEASLLIDRLLWYIEQEFEGAQL